MLKPLQLSIGVPADAGRRPGFGLCAFGLAVMARHTPAGADPRLGAQLTFRREAPAGGSGQVSVNLQLLIQSYTDARSAFLTGRQAILRQLERQLAAAAPGLSREARAQSVRALERQPLPPAVRQARGPAAQSRAEVFTERTKKKTAHCPHPGL